MYLRRSKSRYTLSLSCNLTVAPSTYWVLFLLYHDLDVFLYLKWEDDKTYEIINLSCNLMVALSTLSAHWVDKSLHLDKHALLTSNKKMEKSERLSTVKNVNVDFVQTYTFKGMTSLS